MNKQIIEGNWHIVKGRLKQAYSALTEDDFYAMEGNAEECFGVIQRRTGRSRDDIEYTLDRIERDLGHS